MTHDPNRRRRFAASYVLSLIVHGFALLALIVVTIDRSDTPIDQLTPTAVTLDREGVEAPASPATVRPVTAVKIAPTPRTSSPAVGSRVTSPLGQSHGNAGASRSRPFVRPTPVFARVELARLRPDAQRRAKTPAIAILIPPPPTVLATAAPLVGPSAVPTLTPSPGTTMPVGTVRTATLSADPTFTPTAVPTVAPSAPSSQTPAPTPRPALALSAIPGPAQRTNSILAPTADPTLPPSAAPTIEPKPVPHTSPSPAPTLAPTQAPTVEPTRAPTAEPTRAPTVEPTRAPTAHPTLAPAVVLTEVPIAQPTIAPSLEPSPNPSRHPVTTTTAGATLTPRPVAPVSPTGVATLASEQHVGHADKSSSAPTGVGTSSVSSIPVALPPGRSRTAATGATSGGDPTRAAPAATQPSAIPGATLNDRLRALSAGGDVDYTPRHVAINDAQSLMDRAMAAYEAELAPSAEILRRTFGVVYERRTGGHPDSIAYVFDTYKIGPITMCKAWKIVEHPEQSVHEVGPVARSAGIGGGVVTNDNSAVIRHDIGGRPEASIIQFPCSRSSYQAVAPGSVTAPLGRHLDTVGGPSPTPLPTQVP